jgi:uncharacterized protein (TIGR02266 family)
MEGIEKRTHPRVPLVAKVEAEAEGRTFLAVTQDISSGGMRIATANPASVGATVELTIILPDSERKIRVRGIVRHHAEGSAMGIQFLDLSDADRAALRAFLASQ